jgi:hypothetical protein
MNLQKLLAAIIGSARRIGAEKVFVSKFDVAASTGLVTRACDDPFIDQIIPSIPGEAEVESPMIYSADAIAPGWAIFVAGGSVNFKDLAEWSAQEEA